jgi:hypothetical protein
VHDHLKKVSRLGSQSILPSTSFALAQQASSREYSKSLTKDDDDESHGGSRTEKTPHGSSQIKNTTAHRKKRKVGFYFHRPEIKGISP